MRDAALAAQAGTGAGNNLLAVSITVNLAPVFDVFRAPGDFIDQYQRPYGSNPAVVAQLAGTFITAQQQTGVAATAKHYPGLGAATTSQNTDSGPVTTSARAVSRGAAISRPVRWRDERWRCAGCRRCPAR